MLPAVRTAVMATPGRAAARRQQLRQQGPEVRRVLPGDDQVPAEQAVLEAMGGRGLASFRSSP